MTETRKLAAILVADVVGYSRLAGADEERTLSRLRGLRSDLIDGVNACCDSSAFLEEGHAQPQRRKLGADRRATDTAANDCGIPTMPGQREVRHTHEALARDQDLCPRSKDLTRDRRERGGCHSESPRNVRPPGPARDSRSTAVKRS